ncbi:MAG: DUF1013 domain-containing protein [Alphaproteobacteria bacterium]|nr:hypothetical protein [Hyphomonas sp.]MBR9808166.1 DUF1013 domain-containing protein [Alphaproteobacteria bacterium]
MSEVLMPKATAVWLLDNTSLTFSQIADFCGLHYLEVKGIADGDVAENMRGVDPIAGGILSRAEIRKGEDNEGYKLKVAESKIAHIPQPKRKGSRYTPVIRRQDKPDAVAWFIRNHPEVSDAQISKLIGTTKSTINNVRDKSHWNSPNIRPVDPVTLGLCTQIELDEVISKSAEKRRKMEAEKAEKFEGPGIAPAHDEPGAYDAQDDDSSSGAEPSADDIFKNFS